MLLAASCGGSGQSDQAQIEATTQTFFDGVFSSDGKKACSVLSGSFKTKLAPNPVLLSCEDAIKAVGEGLGGDDIARIQKALKKAGVVINGDSATESLPTADGGSVSVPLLKVEGKWYVTGLTAPGVSLGG